VPTRAAATEAAPRRRLPRGRGRRRRTPPATGGTPMASSGIGQASTVHASPRPNQRRTVPRHTSHMHTSGPSSSNSASGSRRSTAISPPPRPGRAPATPSDGGPDRHDHPGSADHRPADPPRGQQLLDRTIRRRDRHVIRRRRRRRSFRAGSSSRRIAHAHRASSCGHRRPLATTVRRAVTGRVPGARAGASGAGGSGRTARRTPPRAS
jgi:hypothetical protein